MSPSRHAPGNEPSEPHVEVIRAPTVAIIDDDVELAKAVGRVLRASYRCVVNGYSSVEEFLAGVDKIPSARKPVGDVDLILLDFHLPGKDGPKLVCELKKRNSRMLEKTAIMGITGDDQTVVYNGFKAAGIDEILLKPLRALDYRRIAEQAYKVCSGGMPPAMTGKLDRVI
jgi:FixJ family two-component response regulator